MSDETKKENVFSVDSPDGPTWNFLNVTIPEKNYSVKVGALGFEMKLGGLIPDTSYVTNARINFLESHIIRIHKALELLGINIKDLPLDKVD